MKMLFFLFTFSLSSISFANEPEPDCEKSSRWGSSLSDSRKSARELSSINCKKMLANQMANCEDSGGDVGEITHAYCAIEDIGYIPRLKQYQSDYTANSICCYR